MKAKLRGRDTSTLSKLEAELLNCWAEFKHETLQNLAETVPKHERGAEEKKEMP